MIATLPMYDFAEVRGATQSILGAIARELTNATGVTINPGFAEASDHQSLIGHWRSSTTAFSQSCGLPIVEHLLDVKRPVATIVWRGVSDPAGGYQSRIVVRRDDPRELDSLQGARVIVNDPGSLSGWWSLGVALFERGYDRDDFASVAVSNAHVASLAAVTEGRADVAAIDAATFRLLERYRPSSTDNVRVIGACPLIPATPFVVARTLPISDDDVFAALVRAFANPEVATARETMGIEGVGQVTEAMLAGLRERVVDAECALGRRDALRNGGS